PRSPPGFAIPRPPAPTRRCPPTRRSSTSPKRRCWRPGCNSKPRRADEEWYISVMIAVGTVFDDGNVKLEIARLEPDRRNAEMELRAVYVPGSKPPPLHYHPNQEERFIISEGALRFRVGKEERIVAAGQELIVPPGAHHLAQNASQSEPAVVRWI